MQRSQGAILLVVGAILIYLSIFGLTGLSALQLTGSWSDDFNDNVIDTAKWQVKMTTSCTVAETSQLLRMSVATGVGRGLLISKLASSFEDATVSIRVVATQNSEAHLGLSVSPDLALSEYAIDVYYILIQARTSQSQLFIQRRVSGVEKTMYTGSLTTVTGSLKISVSTGTIKFLYNDVVMYSEPFALSSKTVYPYIQGIFGVGTAAQTDVDDFVLTVSGTPPPGTGNLQVMGYADQTGVQFLAYYVGPSGQSPTVTVPNSGYMWANIATGSYTVYGTYNGIQKNQQVTVVAGQTATATLTFSGTPPLETPDFLKWIKDTLNNPIVKNIMLLSGVGMCGVGLIVLVWPTKHVIPAYPTYH